MRKPWVPLLLLLIGCIDSQPPTFMGEPVQCRVSADCAAGLTCVATRCTLRDPCGAGIYVADTVPARPDADGRFDAEALIRQVSGAEDGVFADEGQLRVVQAGAARRFELDFYDEPSKPESAGLFVEARLRLGAGSRDCGAYLGLWISRRTQISVCIGGDTIGLRRPEGGSTDLVDDVPDLTEMRTYRVSVKPGDGPEERGSIVELHIDGVLAATGLSVDDLPAPAAASDRAPLVEFGAETPGTVVIDFIRWGCNPDGGPCRPDLQEDDDDCETGRQTGGACDGRAVAAERCDELDNDCDGLIDEDYSAGYLGGPSISFDLFGVEVFKGEGCGLRDACADARVVCDADGFGLACDVSQVAAAEDCDGADNDCDGLVDEDFSTQSQTPEDLYVDPLSNERLGLGDACGTGNCAAGTVVCQDLRPACSTDAIRLDAEVCGNARDDDCDGRVDEGFDADEDGYQDCPRCATEVCEGGAHDCDDSRVSGAQINPGAFEVCNLIDDDCDGVVDDGLDLDGDGFLPCGLDADCRDNPADDVEGEPRAFEINPSAAEACDRVDNDCDGRVDEGFSLLEPDGALIYTTRAHCGRCGNDCDAASADYNTAGICTERPGGGFGCSPTCRPGFADVSGDLRVPDQFWNAGEVDADTGCECRIRADTLCDSGDPNRACAEICNGVDDDCDGSIDEEFDMDLPACWTGAAQQRSVGVCRDGVRRCIDGRISDVCFDAVLPAGPEEGVCDGQDDDCDGRVDEGEGLTDVAGERRAGDACDTGRAGACALGQLACVDDGLACLGAEPAAEICDGRDTDCDGRTDEGFVRADDQGNPIGLDGEPAVTADMRVYDQLEHCGGCGVECARRNGVTSCEAGACSLVACRDGYLDLDGDPDNGCEESDCRPDNVGAQNVRLIGTLCSKPMYADGPQCACTGVYRCVRRGGVPDVQCVVDPNNANEGDVVPPPQCPAERRANVQPETCDQLDNDCDGAADEVFVRQGPDGRPLLDNEGNLIYATVEHCGECNRLCAPPFTLIAGCGEGTCEIVRCEDGHVDLNDDPNDGCEYACVFGGRELCNGEDDDCDGRIDEGLDGCAP